MTSVPRAAIERCVGDPDAFVAGHWGREPLLHHEPATPGFADLLDLPDVDHLITGTLLRMPSFRLVKDGTPLDPASYTQTVRIGSSRADRSVRPDRVLDLFAEGATIVLQALHRQSPAVAAFCRDLELFLTHPVQANAYVTPAVSKGFALHHDTHDVFVLQTRGRKRWRVYRPLVELPTPGQRWSRVAEGPGEPIIDAELRPGDCLYLPRGFPHEAEARDEVSIHVTVGIQATTWLDLWTELMKGAEDHLPFREALPVGFAREPDRLAEEVPGRLEELRGWLGDAAGKEAASDVARRFWRTRRPMLSGQMGNLARIASIDTATPLRLRRGGVFEISGEDGEAVVLLGGRELRMPGFAEAALRFISAASGPFQAADMPGLDDASRLVLVRRLVREGALDIVDGGS